MSNKTQISEIKLVDLVRKVWDKMHYVEDPPHVIQRMQNPPAQQIDLPLTVQKGGKAKAPKSKGKVKAQQQIFDFLKTPVQMPKHISKKDWTIGFDLTKPPFYTDRDIWYADNVKQKYTVEKNNRRNEKTWVDTYIGEDLTTYGFPYKANDQLPNNRYTYGLQIMNEWNKAKAFQVYYETKITNYLKQKHEDELNHRNN